VAGGSIIIGAGQSQIRQIDCEARKNGTPPSALYFDVLGITAGKRIDFIFHDGAFRTVGNRVCAGHPSDHDAVTSQLRLERKL
jgi:hypothetical protein